MICQDQQRKVRTYRNMATPVNGTQQFRIQVQDIEAEGWRTYASFCFRGEAEACLDALRQRGIEARVISS